MNFEINPLIISPNLQLNKNSAKHGHGEKTFTLPEEIWRTTVFPEDA